VLLAGVVCAVVSACGGGMTILDSQCQPSEIGVKAEGFGAATFHYARVYAIVNTGTSACRLSGYPRVIAHNYPYSIPLRVHENSSQIWMQTSNWGRPAQTVNLRPGGKAAFVIAWVENPDASAARLRYCERQPLTAIKLLLPHTTQPVPGTHILVGLCPTKYVGSDIEISPILVAAQAPNGVERHIHAVALIEHQEPGRGVHPQTVSSHRAGQGISAVRL
jgi:Protein of unknown function (DUF4232)